MPLNQLRLTLLVTVLCTACDRPPVAWNDPVEVSAPAGSTRLLIDQSGRMRFVGDAVQPRARPAAPGMCPGSFRTASGQHDLYGVWWSVRPDSSAVLYAAVSDDSGATWRPPLKVDTADVSSRGCLRPAPSITAVADTVHIAYSMAAKEGMGVFFAHSMERGTMFHSPVAVEYGDRLVATSVAGDGSEVAVAYEEPNGSTAEVHVALSHTLGHIFDSRTAASRSSDEAVAPLVGIAGRRVAVSWLDRRQLNTDSTTSRRLVRLGTMQ